MKKTLILAGAGHANLQVLKHIQRNRAIAEAVNIHLIDQYSDYMYSGMVPAVLYGQRSRQDISINLQALAARLGIHFHCQTITGLDSQSKIAYTNHNEFSFDVASLNIGMCIDDKLPQNVFFIKPLQNLFSCVDHVSEKLQERDRVTFIIIGAGAAGVELSLALAAYFQNEIGSKRLDLILCYRSKTILPHFPKAARNSFETLLRKANITLLHSCNIKEIKEDKLQPDKQGAINYDVALLTGKGKPVSWLQNSGLALDKSGFVEVHPTLQSLQHETIFVSGDIMSFPNKNVQKSGVYAVRSGAALAKNLIAHLEGRSLAAYKPQSNALYLINMGANRAGLIWRDYFFENDLNMRFKYWLDERFLQSFQMT